MEMKLGIITAAVIFICGLPQISINGQEVNYYKLTKIEDYGKVENRCIGGQFIKVSKNVCFDSDAHGNYIGNGKLYRDVNNHSANFIYVGQSYHGNVKYIFSQDYKSLIVEITPKYRYIYSLTVPPAGVTTCSLIRSGRSSSSEPQTTPYHSPNGNNSGYYNGGSNNNSNSNSNNNTNNNTPTRRFKCAYCNGTGTIEKNDNAPATYGNDRPRQQCQTCGKWYDPNVFTHYHQKCRHCGGTGYAK